MTKQLHHFIDGRERFPFGDTHIYGPGHLRFYARSNVIFARRPTGVRAGVQ